MSWAQHHRESEIHASYAETTMRQAMLMYSTAANIEYAAGFRFLLRAIWNGIDVLGATATSVRQMTKVLREARVHRET